MDTGEAFIISFQYKIHTHNILYTYYKVQHHAFRILRILQQIYYLYIYPKIFFCAAISGTKKLSIQQDSGNMNDAITT